MKTELWKTSRIWPFLLVDGLAVLMALSTGWFREGQIIAMAIGFVLLTIIEHRIGSALAAAGATKSDRLKWRLGLYAVIFIVIALAAAT